MAEVAAKTTDVVPPEPSSSAAVSQYQVSCPNCKSVILLPGKGHLNEHQYSLPCVTQDKALIQSGQSPTSDVVQSFIKVEDMFTFENVGFTNSVNGIKYLTCADCELGPIGYQQPESKLCFIAIDRVTAVGVVSATTDDS